MDPPGQANDAQLIVLLHAWSPENGHTADVYKQALQEKFARYKTSAASMVGRYSYHHESGTGPANKYDHGQHVNANVRDTKLVLHTYDDETPTVLMYYKKDQFAHEAGHRRHYDESKPWPGVAIDKDFKPWKQVEAEFVDVAIANNMRAWGKEYDVIQAPHHEPSMYELMTPPKYREHAQKPNSFEKTGTLPRDRKTADELSKQAISQSVGATSASSATGPFQDQY